MSILIGQKSTNKIAQYLVEGWRGFLTSGTFRRPSGEFRRVFRHSGVENDILTMQRFLDVSRFLYSGGWQVCLSTSFPSLNFEYGHFVF